MAGQQRAVVVEPGAGCTVVLQGTGSGGGFDCPTSLTCYRDRDVRSHPTVSINKTVGAVVPAAIDRRSNPLSGGCSRFGIDPGQQEGEQIVHRAQLIAEWQGFRATEEQPFIHITHYRGLQLGIDAELA